MLIAAALSDSTTGLHLRDVELENTVNEVPYKVISLINMTHTHTHTHTRDILKLKNSALSAF